MKTNQVIRIIIPLVFLLGAATVIIVAVLGNQQANTSVNKPQETNAVNAFVAYLKIDGMDGEATEANHQKWIDVLAFSHNVMVPSEVGTSRTTGIQKHAPLRITKMVDKTSPKLFEKCAKGAVISKVELECCKAFGEQLKVFYRIELQNARIISVQDYGITSGDIPTETVSFTYEYIKWTYTEYDNQGQSKGNVESEIYVETPA
ncbi:MAG: Hcp family type VI secretion system effector [Candidatus Hodarchaeota archaeon]